ncbi:MAG: hypothetical protein K5666_04085 [Bacilli bacterium]|nr:hypothetical protein [Bacilli bacterium]
MGSGVRGNFGKTKGSISLAANKNSNIITIKLLSSADKSVKIKAEKAPIKIPQNAIYEVQHKKGYDQIKYKYSRGKKDYEVRWHTQTPNAPSGTGSTYQITRTKKGFGYGTNASQRVIDHMIKYPSGKTIWVSDKTYQNALRNNKMGKATKKEKEIVKYGHIK